MSNIDPKTREKIKLSGFNNLTKALSFNLYDFCIAVNDERKAEYIEYINRKYNAQRIKEISEEVCKIIDAEILNVSIQDYEPVGASTLVLMSDIAGGGWEAHHPESTAQVNMHLDKSHITAHTYPDGDDPQGICSFRVDIDIATCGEIIPLKAVNYLFKSFECDVVVIDYVVRGFTRTSEGKKIYNDYFFNSIQDFISPDILEQYPHRSDINLSYQNIWQTKLMLGEEKTERYLMRPEDINHPDIKKKMKILHQEMRDVFNMMG